MKSFRAVIKNVSVWRVMGGKPGSLGAWLALLCSEIIPLIQSLRQKKDEVSNINNHKL